MDTRTFQRWAGFAAVAAGLLFLVDLFLGWERVSVRVGTMVDIDATASGFRGWGIAAAVFDVALLALVARHGIGSPPRRPRALIASALGLVIFTSLAVYAVDADVNFQTSYVGLEANTTLWPAWIGLVLAIVAAAAALAPLVLEFGRRDVHRLAPHGSR